VQFWCKEINNYKKSADVVGAILLNGRNGGKIERFFFTLKDKKISYVLVLQNASKIWETKWVSSRNRCQIGATFQPCSSLLVVLRWKWKPI